MELTIDIDVINIKFSLFQQMLTINLIQFCKERQTVRADSAPKIHTTIYYNAKIRRGIVKWIMSVHQKCMCTTVNYKNVPLSLV